MNKPVQKPYIPSEKVIEVSDCEADRKTLMDWVGKACYAMSKEHIRVSPRDRDCADLNQFRVMETLETLAAKAYQLGREWEKGATQACLV